jgi:hypothetical protein
MIIHESTHQGSEQWDEWRAVRATASEFGKIFTGGGKVSGQREPYMRKCAVAREYKLPAWAGNEHTDRGHALEPVARQMFTDLSGLDVREVSCIEHENGLCGGSPDSLIYAPDGRLISGLEIKCYGYEKHVGIVTEGKMPTDCKPQVHGLLFLSRLPCWQFMVYHDDALPFDMRTIEIEPDAYTDALENEIMAFCEELDRRADEFIADFEKSLRTPLMERMPILRKTMGKLEPELEESLI